MISRLTAIRCFDYHAYFSVTHLLHPNLGDTKRFPGFGTISIVSPTVVTNRGFMDIF